jgi:hypothetical protein
MGGGGGGRSVAEHILDLLEAKAKKELAAASASRRNVFISFSFDDVSQVNLLRGQALNESSDLEFSDRSVRVPFPERTAIIEEGIRAKIRQSSVTVCVLTDSSAQSEWVDWEIRESIAMGKGVVGMYLGDSPPQRLPESLREHHVEVVPWRHDALMTAIARAAERRTAGDK